MSFDPSCIDVEDYLDCLDVRNIVQATESEIRFSCPLPTHEGADLQPSCYMNTHTTAFFCHGCKARGNAIHFTEAALGVSYLEAIRLLKERYSPGSINPDARGMVEEVQKIMAVKDSLIEQPILDESLIERFALKWDEAYYHWSNGNGHPATDYMIERGFDPLALDEWEFGYDEISDRITFAVRDEQGRLIGFKARAYDDRHPKYLVLGDGGKETRYGFPRYFPSRVVYGAHRAGQDSEVVICEGELNAVAVRSCTGRLAVAINGSHFSPSHAKIIRSFASKAIVFLDDDSAGRDATWGWIDVKGEYHPGIVPELSPYMPVELVPEHELDAAEYQRQQLEEELKGLLDRSEALLLRYLRDGHLSDRKVLGSH